MCSFAIDPPYTAMMGSEINLRAADGHECSAYLAEPDGEPRAGLVVIHEIFGLTEQMKRCADRYADAGYRSIVPAMFDRVEPGLVLGYSEFHRGGRAAMSIDTSSVLADVEAARQAVAAGSRAAIMGFCWGGTVAYMGACGLDFACGISYYGGGIGRLLDRMQPKIPVIYHFGAEDAFIPADVISAIRAADPDGEFHVYPDAGHGFACDDREGYAPEAAELATSRSMAFLAKHL